MIRLLSGDCRDVLPTLAAESVHCVVTSPPYYGLRDYGTALWDGGDAGCDHANGRQGATRRDVSPERLAERAALYGTGTGAGSDVPPQQYADTCGRCGAVRVDRQIGLEGTPEEYLATMVGVFREIRRVMRTDAVAFINMGDSYTDKQLLLMPARLALALQADGWWVRSDIIWHKPNPMPESVTDRPTSAYEHVFLLTKAPRYYFDGDAIRESATADNREVFRGAGSYVNGNSHSNAAVMSASGKGHVDGIGTRSCRNVWTIATSPFSAAHFATFPPELAERCIKAGTSERGCCAACGKPWVRVTERNLDNIPTRMATKRAPVDCAAMAAYLRERREALGLSRAAVDEALGTRTLYSWFEGRPAGIEPPTPEQWTKLKAVLALDARFDEQIYGTVEVVITDHSPSKAAGVRTYAKAWNSETETTGWAPGCKCYNVTACHDERQEPKGRDSPGCVDSRVGAAGGAAAPAQPIPCTVLDPFAGAGTTLLVADRLQRDAVGIELNTAYTEMAMERVRADAPLFTAFPPAEDPEDERMGDLFTDMAAD